MPAQRRSLRRNRAPIFCSDRHARDRHRRHHRHFARARLTAPADDVSKTGQAKAFTTNGESYVALITAAPLDDLRRYREAEHLSMLKAPAESAEDIESGQVDAWDDFKPRLARLRAKAKCIAAK